jgi:hypothetical protein
MKKTLEKYIRLLDLNLLGSIQAKLILFGSQGIRNVEWFPHHLFRPLNVEEDAEPARAR